MRILFIDPGKFAGWAFFRKGVISECGLVCGHRKADWIPQTQQFINLGAMLKPVRVVYESAFIYPKGSKKKKSNVRDEDIVNLAGLGGRLAGCAAGGTRMAEIVSVLPRTWKGTLPKDMLNRRTAARCPHGTELMAHLPDGQHNHVWDAIGLGLWYIDRHPEAKAIR